MVQTTAAQAAWFHTVLKIVVGSAVVVNELRIASPPHHGSKGMLTIRLCFVNKIAVREHKTHCSLAQQTQLPWVETLHFVHRLWGKCFGVVFVNLLAGDTCEECI